MSNFIPAWRGTSANMIAQDPMTAYVVGTIPNYPGGTAIFFQEEECIDPSLGEGQFVYALANGTITAGNVVELSAAGVSIGGGASVVLALEAVQWAGTANSGKALAVALASLVAGQYGWFQTQGFAFVTCNGTPTAGNPVYWQAAGVISGTGVASKQMLGAVWALAPGASLGQAFQGVVPTLAAGFAIVLINEPEAQGAIT
jgi:predicted RecA/RadA family phage recombinase